VIVADPLPNMPPSLLVPSASIGDRPASSNADGDERRRRRRSIDEAGDE
jgi:hypothetical protein